MKRIVLIVTLALLFTARIWCEDDERRYLFGENYRDITEVSKDSVPLLRDNAEALWKLAKGKNDVILGNGVKNVRFFKEQCGSTEFYRAVFKIENPYGRHVALYGEDLQFFLLAYKGKLFILNAEYLVKGEAGDGTVHSSDTVTYSNTHAVKTGNSYSIIEHHTKVREDVYIDPEGDGDVRIEDSGSGEASVYALEDIIHVAERKADESGSLITLNIEPYRTIYCGKTLIDEKRPFMYTIQNAFDGNPDTSYVENSEDDGIAITIYQRNAKKSHSKLPNRKTLKIGIINGYAKNEKLYKANNRIKTLAINGRAFELADTFSRKFRFFDVPEENGLAISSAALYNGTGYTDTCIAEITVE